MALVFCFCARLATKEVPNHRESKELRFVGGGLALSLAKEGKHWVLNTQPPPPLPSAQKKALQLRRKHRRAPFTAAHTAATLGGREREKKKRESSSGRQACARARTQTHIKIAAHAHTRRRPAPRPGPALCPKKRAHVVCAKRCTRARTDATPKKRPPSPPKTKPKSSFLLAAVDQVLAPRHDLDVVDLVADLEQPQRVLAVDDVAEDGVAAVEQVGAARRQLALLEQEEDLFF